MVDIETWTLCFTLYIAVLSKKKTADMVPSMVAHLHTVIRLQQKASHQLAWLEYDFQFRMELAASADHEWTGGDPWQYVSCLPGLKLTNDHFEVSELESQSQSSGKGKGKLRWNRTPRGVEHRKSSQPRKQRRVSAAFATRHPKAVHSARSAFSPTAVQAAVPSTSTAEPAATQYRNKDGQGFQPK